jgi:hypothetical protein
MEQLICPMKTLSNSGHHLTLASSLFPLSNLSHYFINSLPVHFLPCPPHHVYPNLCISGDLQLNPQGPLQGPIPLQSLFYVLFPPSGQAIVCPLLWAPWPLPYPELIPEDSHLCTHCHEKLKSYKILLFAKTSGPGLWSTQPIQWVPWFFLWR